MADRAATHVVYAGRLDRLDDSTLRQAAKDVAAIVDSPGWAFIQGLVQAREQQVLDRVVAGGLKTLENFEAETALVRGMRETREVAQTVLYVAQRREVEIERQAAERREED